jgi:dTMP kinase
MKEQGRFITFEGGDGSGKSTQVKALAVALKKRKIDPVLTREPGGSPGADEIRKLVLTGEPERWDVMTETLLMFAARNDHVARTIKPALAKKKWVISDRFTDSTYAYQGAGGGLARESIRRLESLVLHDFRPDLTLILDLAPDIGLARTQSRRHDETRFEKFDLAFHQRLRDTYLAIARRDPMRCVVIDAAADEKTVAASIWNAVAQRFRLP